MIKKIVLVFIISWAIALICVGKEQRRPYSSRPSNKSAANANTVYKYKEYEKFDFESMMVDAEDLSPGDLSIRPRYQQMFKNMLPYRRNFRPEIHRAIERVR
ncbi:MAG: hypothetical protein A2504_05465 [Bdellovibrionales bacterium RIFOXYD12_FULL_39_22]|nr:MAG: hypothetical protein A2385_06360 [Bdellovibrionales bacterium RIFOXYB1_FULL_39_21]OFZ41901.1 MAG: hypothetical protein A2485_08330 [Bdellovibrionales bacterium RIFOXYC12_FULL_39_17]OFZ50617.1 MAG: hypothetical protein A2404_05280 [Bdellovibrionales bacterium RIFOXYC1_FULL_39_130]OFZ70601.1 MAG: hypothetical protein A2451_06850 [Bdellovibrionales bacterium RIFOXYC2_FULL_39_8]OFZ77840.1 MAG: hypothetical protein A2560_00450 [Bdellovibrionales bacterium RIFOXYD1_FULL_39_84]OFZ93724.1 MAG: